MSVSNRSNGAGQLVMMMMNIGLVGIGAGAAAALLFASVTTGSWLAIVLFYLAPLPVMIAGLGWSQWAALIAAASGALGLAVVFGGMFFIAFLASAGLPAWWLSYLALLARPLAAPGEAAGSAGAPLEWFPPGRLMLWAAALGALTVTFAILTYGFDAESFRSGLHAGLESLLRLDTGSGPEAAKAKRFLDFLVEAIPPAAAVLSTLTNLLNLWLGALVVKFSGRLSRPWPALADMQFPRLAAAALAIAVILSFLGGLISIIAGVATASLLLAYGLLGFAVLHAITRGLGTRGFLLAGVYAAVLVFGWPLLVLCLVGLIDQFFDLRGRVARKRRGPPAPS
jgi:hypothetical protein